MNKGLRGIFGKISLLYEVFNHLITAGLDSVWRRKAAHIAAGVGSSIWMDVCCGTGNMATSLKRSIDSPGVGIAVDYSAAMLHRAYEKPELRSLSLVLADAKTLPFRENVIDLASIAFATRNLSISLRSLRQSLGEIYRVLKPNGWFLNLETSQPRNKTINRLFKLYIRIVLGKLTAQLPSLRSASKYLEYSIGRFYDPVKFGRILGSVGFTKVVYYLFSFGAVAAHQSIKASP